MIKLLISFFLVMSTCFEGQVIFKTPPKDFASKTEAAICFIKAGDKVLFLKRQMNKPEGGTWGVPGGKIDQGETPRQAVLREVSEETGLDLEEVSSLGTVYLHGSKDVVLHIFEAKPAPFPLQVKLSPSEHQEYKWISLENSKKMPLISGEEEMIANFYGITG
jgi:mutator protein MutT